MIDIYLDTADLSEMREARKNPLIKGYTTNPTLMRKAGASNYTTYAKNAIDIVEGLPISFEVFSDDFNEMEEQAHKIASWGRNIYIKIPITNTKGESSVALIRKLSNAGIKCNITAVFTTQQARIVSGYFANNSHNIISIFAGRIADTGRNPMSKIDTISKLFSPVRKYQNLEVKILWASTREVLNITQAERCGCDIITVSPDLLKKYEQYNDKDLDEFSLDTVKMFYEDAKAAGYKL